MKIAERGIQLIFQKWSLAAYYALSGALVFLIGTAGDEVVRSFGGVGFFLHFTIILWLVLTQRRESTSCRATLRHDSVGVETAEK